MGIFARWWDGGPQQNRTFHAKVAIVIESRIEAR